MSILDQLGVPNWKNLYLLGSYGRTVTFHAQQIRAFNLVAALDATQEIDTVLVVGAGLAGVTAATALLMKGKKVHLIESQTQELAVQRGNKERYIHPNLLTWPALGAQNSKTELPDLNWQAGMLDHVVGTIAARWSILRGGFGTKLRFEAETRLESIKATELVLWREVGGRSKPIPTSNYSAIILAIGFGSDETMNAAGSRSYWRNNGLHQEVLAPGKRRRVMVSGIGDGGLIEVQRLTLKNFEHQTFTETLVRSKLIPPTLIEELRTIEARLAVRQRGVLKFLNDQYAKLKVPSSLDWFIESQIRKDTVVVLVGQKEYPYSPSASALNRFVVHLLLRIGHVEYVQGSTGPLQFISQKLPYAVEILRPAGATMEAFDEVVIRHGPTRDHMVRAVLGRQAQRKLHLQWSRPTQDTTIERSWEIPADYAYEAQIGVTSSREDSWLILDPKSLEARVARVLVFAGVEAFVLENSYGADYGADMEFTYNSYRYIIVIKSLRVPLGRAPVATLRQIAKIPNRIQTMTNELPILIIFSRSGFAPHLELQVPAILWTLKDMLQLEENPEELPLFLDPRRRMTEVDV